MPLRLEPPAGKIDLLLSAAFPVPSYIIVTSSVPSMSATKDSKVLTSQVFCICQDFLKLRRLCACLFINRLV